MSKKQNVIREKVVIYSFYNIFDKTTYCLFDDDRIITFSGIDVFDNLLFDKKKDYIIFSNVVFYLAQLYYKNCKIEGEAKVSPEMAQKEPLHLINTYYKNVTFRNFNFFSKGNDLKKLMFALDELTEVHTMRAFIRQIGNPVDVKWSLAYNAEKAFYEPIKEAIKKFNKKHSHYYYYFDTEYTVAMCGNKAGLLSSAKCYAKNVFTYDMSSAYPSVMINDALFPIGRTRVVDTISNTAMLKMCVCDRIKFKNWFKIVITGKLKGFLDFYEQKTDTTVLEFYNVCETILDKRFNKLFNAIDEHGFENVIYVVNSNTGYLPKDFRDEIMRLYALKETLADESVEKFFAKVKINCLYGKGIQERTPIKARKHFKSEYVLMTPEISLHCTAVVRYNLKKAILNNKTVYFDTDGITVLDKKYAEPYFERQNVRIYNKNKMAGYDTKIGTWKLKGFFDEFIVVDKKRYISRQGDKYNITWAGMTADEKERLLQTYPNIIRSLRLLGIDWKSNEFKFNWETKTIDVIEHTFRQRFEGRTVDEKIGIGYSYLGL